MFKKISLFFSLFFVFLSALPALAEEKILHFRSDITVHSNSDLTVTETIQVQAEGIKIKRGIYRDFPTKYTDNLGNTVRVGFKVFEIKRDGIHEPYHFSSLSNGERIYIGQKDVTLRPGIYTYTIKYYTNRQLGYFEDYDELYWNVTGNDWDFPIENAVAQITLPEGAHIVQETAYTGIQGSTGRDYITSYSEKGDIVYRTTRRLNPNEGFTIAVAWPKGFVKEPSAEENLRYFMQDNMSTLVALGFLTLLIIYYIFAWLRAGQDIPKGTIIPLFEPPLGFSPGAVNYVHHMGFGGKDGANTAFAAALVSMAVKGYIKIHENDKKYTIEKTGNDKSRLSSGEKAIAEQFFRILDSITLTQKNHRKIGKAFENFKKRIKTEYEKIYFLTNSSYLIPGAVITIIALVGIVVTASDPGLAGFMVFWLTMWTTGCLALFLHVIKLWKGVLRGQSMYFFPALFMTAFSIPFFGAEFIGLTELATAVSVSTIVLFVLLIAINLVFYELMKAPTLEGREVMDKIEGYKMYLSTAEKHRLDAFHPPEMTVERFEKNLPYAIALSVDNKWGEQFTNTVAKSALENYKPDWYSGRHFHEHGVNFSDFTSSIGSNLASSVAASSTAPGSSSGSGGGGSSGGGGGGGGGGGW